MNAERIIESLREWQDYAGTLSDALLALGHHNAAHHQSPQEYDAESGLACSIPTCIEGFIRQHRVAA
jgi:hypothetical protein